MNSIKALLMLIKVDSIKQWFETEFWRHILEHLNKTAKPDVFRILKICIALDETKKHLLFNVMNLIL